MGLTRSLSVVKDLRYVSAEWLGLGSSAEGVLLGCATNMVAPELGREGAFGGCLLKYG